jgi:tRNA (cmo5U34)-methyltransferase
MKKDNIFNHPQDRIPPFEFNDNVVAVFEDMINRSVPFYSEIVRRQVQLAARFYKDGTKIWDLGCSHGNFGLGFAALMAGKPFQLIGIDSSQPMLDKYSSRLQKMGGLRSIELLCSDVMDVELSKASVVVLNLTMQFLDPGYRDQLISKIFEALVPGGVLLITEKIVHEDDYLDELQQAFYYRYKTENGYSRMEISQKRDALENVMIPDSVEVHQKRFTESGFTQYDLWLKWFNFAAWICRKRG